MTFLDSAANLFHCAQEKRVSTTVNLYNTQYNQICGMLCLKGQNVDNFETHF